MSKVQRPVNASRPSKPRPERFDFKFSNFQALQVPKGWDRLFVSLVHAETGKTMAKSGKALVRNGICQWTETISESIYITRLDSSKGYEECLVKLIVSTGSTKSSILGEATISMSHFTHSRVSTVSQPLKNSNYGTILQVKIQCLTPRSKTGDEGSKNSNSQEKNRNMQSRDVDRGSHKSDNSSDSSTSSPLELDSKEESQSASSTILSFDSLERSTGEANLSKNKASSEDYNFFGNQVGGTYNSSPISDYRRSFDNISSSNHLSSNGEAVHRRSSTTNIGSSKHLLEASEDTTEELRAEAKMWERNARKLMADLDLSRDEFSDLLKKQSELIIENDGLKKEIEILKLELEKSTTNQCTQKVLEDEIKYQQGLNGNIGQQLKQSQESNIQLVSVLQELEETVEQQRAEIDHLSSLKTEYTDLENKLRGVEKDCEYKISAKEEEIASLEATLSGYVKGEHFEALDDNNGNNVDLIREVESLRRKVEELEKDCAELTDENLELLFKLKDSNKITDIRKSASFDSMSSENLTVCPSDESDVSDSNLEALERKKNEIENTLSGLRDENVQLRESISGLRDEMDIQTFVLKQKSEDMQKQLLGAQEECEQLKKQKTTLRASAESFAQECTKLQNLNLEASLEISALQDDISILKSELEGCKADKRKLELALQTISGDYEEMKRENILLSEKISILHDAMSEFDECTRNKLVLEEKVQQMEIVCNQNEDLKNELSDIKRENVQFQKKMSRLEEENIECLKKARALEEELKLLNERNKVHKKGVSSKKPSVDGEAVARERYERTKSSLETELRELRERYLEMSLKYAEVETEREDLVMKLKASRGGRRWFS